MGEHGNNGQNGKYGSEKVVFGNEFSYVRN